MRMNIAPGMTIGPGSILRLQDTDLSRSITRQIPHGNQDD